MLELYIIEIPKASKILKRKPQNELAQWIMFLNDPNGSEVSKIMEDNKQIKEAMEELEKISQDKELRRIAQLREKAIRDEQNGLRHAREEGIKEGIKEGIEQQKMEIAKEMKKQKYNNEEIQKITKLTIEQIEKL